MRTWNSGPAKGGPLAIVLAGGRGERIGPLGRILPKCMLPVSADDTLGSRLLGQLVEAGIRRTIVSTSSENHALIKAFVERIIGRWSKREGGSRPHVTVFLNPAHRMGPLPALAEVIKQHASNEYVLALADIALTSNPFAVLSSTHSGTGSLVVGPYVAGRGGVVVTNGDAVLRLMHDAVRTPPHAAPDGTVRFNWTGAAQIGAAFVSEVLELAATSVHKPLEDVFNAALARGLALSYVKTDAFVNVNSLAELADCQDILRAAALDRSAHQQAS
jgi:NDP-sugar pyrophosphorylase family protein